MKKHYEVVCAVIKKDGKYFICQRGPKGECGNKWEFPGGKIETGETHQQALIREIKEELNSVIKVNEFIMTVNHEYNTFSITMHAYLCELIEGFLEISEHIDKCFITEEEFSNYDLALADLPIVDGIFKSVKLNFLRLSNYKSFKDTKIFFDETTILVGKNNAGKSSAIEAIRLVSYVTKKFKNTKYIRTPMNFAHETKSKGFLINPDDFKIHINTIPHFYTDSVAEIEAEFDNEFTVLIYICESNIFATVKFMNQYIESTKSACKIDFGRCNILPQISLLRENERNISEIRVKTKSDTYLSSLHFRNEMFLYKDLHFDKFKKIVKSEINGLIILDLYYDEYDDTTLKLMVEDNRFTCEVSLLGSGTQMLLQILWFIVKNKGSNIIIFDEPDVFMHPDLQIRLFYLLKRYFKQVIIATHSVEIIHLVEPCNIVAIDNKLNENKSLSCSENIVNLLEILGSTHNLSLLKLSKYNKILFVEGEDLKLLKKILKRKNDNLNFFEKVIDFSLGGASNFPNAIHITNMLSKVSKNNYSFFCILDNDYKIVEQRATLLESASKSKLYLHIWNKKEIESYLINIDVIFRITKKNFNEKNNFVKKIELILEKEKDKIIGKYADEIFTYSKRSKQISTCMDEARSIVNEKWTNLNDKISLMNAKDLITEIIKLIKSTYGVNCTKDIIINEFRYEEFDVELRDLLENIVK